MRRYIHPLIEAIPSARGCTGIYAVMHPLAVDPAVTRKYIYPLIEAESSARGCTGVCLEASPGMDQPQEEIMCDLVGFLVWTGGNQVSKHCSGMLMSLLPVQTKKLTISYLTYSLELLPSPGWSKTKCRRLHLHMLESRPENGLAKTSSRTTWWASWPGQETTK